MRLTLQRLSAPSSQVTSWQAYDMNRYTLYMNAKDKKSVSQNSIHIDAIDASDVTITYFGFIEDMGTRLRNGYTVPRVPVPMGQAP
jgi:hypothetical protein